MDHRPETIDAAQQLWAVELREKDERPKTVQLIEQMRAAV